MVDFRNVNVAVAAVLGTVFVLIGIAGFFSGPTLLVFGVNALHNWVHILSGVVLLTAAFLANGFYAKTANITLGVVYALVAILGFAGILVPSLLNTDADLVPNADNLLHTAFAVVLLVAGFAAPTRADRRYPGTRPV